MVIYRADFRHGLHGLDRYGTCHVELVETSHVILSMCYVRPLDYARGDRASPLKNPCNPCNPCLKLNFHLHIYNMYIYNMV